MVKDVGLEPAGVTLKAVLTVGAGRGRVGTIRASDDEGEDEEGEEKENKSGHTEKVSGEETRAVPNGADEAEEGDEEEENADDDDGPSEEVDAGVVLLGG